MAKHRKDRIYMRLNSLMRSGIIVDFQVSGSYPGLRWFVIPCGFSERAMTTNEVEWFLMGADAVINATEIDLQAKAGGK